MSLHNLPKQAKASRRKAITASNDEVFAWYKAEKAALRDAGLPAAEYDLKHHELLQEFGRRQRRGESRAKRQNTLSKVLERQVRAEVDADLAEKRRGWTG